MILEALIEILRVLIVGVAFLLPTYTPPPAADLGAFQIIAWLIPIGEIITLSSVLLAFVTVTLIYTGVNWCLNKIRGSG